MVQSALSPCCHTFMYGLSLWTLPPPLTLIPSLTLTLTLTLTPTLTLFKSRLGQLVEGEYPGLFQQG